MPKIRRVLLYAARRASDASGARVSTFDPQGPKMTGKAAAERLGVDRTTVYRWAKLGILHPTRTARGQRRYLTAEVEHIAAQLERGEVPTAQDPPTA